MQYCEGKGKVMRWKEGRRDEERDEGKTNVRRERV